MKKLFLLLSIAGFSSASAQPGNLFDIQKHLQKKKTENKKKSQRNPGMKPQFFSAEPFFRSKPQPSFTLPNGDKVMFLHQDNMPCVVPDIRQFRMPNISNPGEHFLTEYFKNRPPGCIPNPAIPRRLISSK